MAIAIVKCRSAATQRTAAAQRCLQRSANTRNGKPATFGTTATESTNSKPKSAQPRTAAQTQHGPTMRTAAVQPDCKAPSKHSADTNAGGGTASCAG